MEPLTRREFLNLAWLTSVGFALSACGYSRNPTSEPTVLSSSGRSPTSVIQASKPLEGSTTVESLLPQYWFSPRTDGLGFERSAQPAKSPLKNGSISAAPPKAWYAPANYFNDADISGLGSCKVGGNISSGDYKFVPLVALQAQAVAISPNQLVWGEGTGDLINVYSIAQEGRLLFQGVLLPYALTRMSITGGMQDAIEGPMAIRTNTGIRYVNRADLWNNSQQIRVNTQAVEKPKEQEYATDVYAHSYPPNRWKPPNKDHCGQDMREFFALLLLTESVADIEIEEWRTLRDRGQTKDIEQIIKQLKSSKEMDVYSKRHNEIDRQLRERDCYFYPEGGSVYNDYKVMRTQAYLRISKGSPVSAETYRGLSREAQNEISEIAHRGYVTMKAQFNKNMTTDEIYRRAFEIVSKYWW